MTASTIIAASPQQESSPLGDLSSAYTDEPPAKVFSFADGDVVAYCKAVAFHTEQPSTAEWSKYTLRPVPNASTMRSARWIVGSLSASSPCVPALRSHLEDSWQRWLLGVEPSTGRILMLLHRDRKAWSPPQAVKEVMELSAPDLGCAQGRINASKAAFKLVLAFRSATSWALGTLESISKGEVSPLDDLFERIVDEWLTLSEDEVDHMIGVATGKDKDLRTPAESLIVSSLASLRRVVQRRRAMVAQMQVKFDASHIPALSTLTGLDTQLCQSFEPSSGRLQQCTLREYIERGLFSEKGLVMLGPARLGKTPAAMSLCRVTSHAWSDVSPGYFIMCSTLDSLRLSAPLFQTGCGLLLDDWSPKTSRNGRGQKCSADELKALFSTASRQISTRYSDTTLPEGPRYITSNACTLDEWCSILPGSVFQMSDAERRDPKCVSADAQAIFKRLYFTFVTTPLLATSPVEEHSTGVREQAAKRARVSMELF